MIEMPGLLLFSLIVMRISGFILLNPVFGRRNIPGLVKGGIIMAFSISLFAAIGGENVVLEIDNAIGYSILLIKEFMIGFVLGFVMNLFFYVTSYAGGMIDFYMGMSMANVYDPQNNASMPLSGSIYNVLMMLLFFTMDGHIAILKIMLESGQVVPYGQVAISPQALNMVLEIFKDCTILAVKLSFPFLALELLAELGVGILMKVIPQINVFVVNIQTKVIVGDILMLLICIPMGEFLNDVINQMVSAAGAILSLL